MSSVSSDGHPPAWSSPAAASSTVSEATTRPEKFPYIIHAALLSISLIYGYFYVAIKLLLHQVGQIELMMLRLGLTAVVVGVLEVFVLKTQFVSTADRRKMLGLGLLGVFLSQVLAILGMARTTAFHASLLMATIPIQILCFSMLTGRERFYPKRALGILLGFAGVAYLLFARDPHVPLPKDYLLGDLFLFFNASCFAWYMILGQSMVRQYNSMALVSYGYMISAVAFLPIFVGASWLEQVRNFEPIANFQAANLLTSLQFTEPVRFDVLAHLNWAGWGALAYIVLLGSVGTYALNGYALRHASATATSAYIFLQPFLAAVFAYYLLHESFTWPMALAGVLTFAGVMLASAPKK